MVHFVQLICHMERIKIGNAAGWCKSLEQVEALAASAVDFIVVGSVTLEPRVGNLGKTFNGESLNSSGMPNPGIEKIKEIAPEMIRVAHAGGKSIILSLGGGSVEEFSALCTEALTCGFDGIELNLSCPNVLDGATRKTIVSYDLILIEEIVRSCAELVSQHSSEVRLTAKFSPFSNPEELVATARIVSACDIAGVVTQNTVPNCLLFNSDGTVQIDTADGTGWAGLSGVAVKAMALGQVNQWRRALDAENSSITVWGVGGVATGRDVLDMKRAGAVMVEVGTAYFTHGAKIFDDIAAEYIDLT